MLSPINELMVKQVSKRVMAHFSLAIQHNLRSDLVERMFLQDIAFFHSISQRELRKLLQEDVQSIEVLLCDVLGNVTVLVSTAGQNYHVCCRCLQRLMWAFRQCLLLLFWARYHGSSLLY